MICDNNEPNSKSHKKFHPFQQPWNQKVCNNFIKWPFQQKSLREVSCLSHFSQNFTKNFLQFSLNENIAQLVNKQKIILRGHRQPHDNLWHTTLLRTKSAIDEDNFLPSPTHPGLYAMRQKTVTGSLLRHNSPSATTKNVLTNTTAWKAFILRI